MKILDLGCGTGWTSIFFAKNGYEVIGVDIAEDSISYANKQKEIEKLDNLTFSVYDYEDLPFNEEFDVVIFFDSLHHSVDEFLAIKMAYRSLKKGGICITSEPGKGHSKQQNSIDAMNNFNVTEKDMPAGKIVKMAKRSGFKRYKVLPHQFFLSKWIFNSVIYTDEAIFFKPRFLRKIAKYLKIMFKPKKNSIVLLVK
ncbi:MAG: class I SAM-dependent methyltransferase [Acidobacteriota bacterium]